MIFDQAGSKARVKSKCARDAMSCSGSTKCAMSLRLQHLLEKPQNRASVLTRLWQQLLRSRRRRPTQQRRSGQHDSSSQSIDAALCEIYTVTQQDSGTSSQVLRPQSPCARCSQTTMMLDMDRECGRAGLDLSRKV